MASTLGYANCTITHFYDYNLQKVVNENNGWAIEKEKFNKICNRLKEANLAVHFSQVAMISTSASVASTAIKFYPLEIQKKIWRNGSDFNRVWFNRYQYSKNN